MAYTPGPWKIKMQDNYMRLYMPGPLKEDVARGYVGEDNARLIAAAPELLEAAEEASQMLFTLAVNLERIPGTRVFSNPAYKRVKDKLHNVIAKAKGEVASDA